MLNFSHLFARIVTPFRKAVAAVRLDLTPDADTEFMSPVQQAAARTTPPLTRVTLYLVSLFCVVALIWANFAVLDEVTVGQGKVIPSSQVQVIQNLEGGILAELPVREGDLVRKDQILARIDDTKAASSWREGRSRYLALLAATARLQAETDGSAPKFPAEVHKEAPDIVKIENNLHHSRQRALWESVASLQRSLQLANDELQIMLPLVDKGAASEVEVLRLRRQVNELRGQIEDKRNKFRTDAQTDLNKNKADLAGLSENNIASQDRMTRTIVRSPVDGVVKRLNVTTIGGVIQPAMDIMEIVPIEDNLLIEAQVKPADIAFLRPGQKGMVKITAYDFSIFGGLPATLEHISADTITDEKKNSESYYRIRVRTQNNYLGSKDKPLPIIPGMTASVEILTGKKSVLDYLLKPFLKAKEKALRER